MVSFAAMAGGWSAVDCESLAAARCHDGMLCAGVFGVLESSGMMYGRTAHDVGKETQKGEGRVELWAVCHAMMDLGPHPCSYPCLTKRVLLAGVEPS